MQYSNHVDNFNRAIAFNFNQKDVTRFGGLASLMNRKISAWLGYNSPTRGQASLIKGLRAASGES